MISFTIDMLGWTPNKGKPITGQTGHPRVHLPNRRLGKLDKLPHKAHNPDRLSQGANWGQAELYSGEYLGTD